MRVCLSLKDAQTPTERAIKAAADQATAETLKLPDGAARMQAVTLALIRCTHTYAGAALAVHVSEITAKRWCIAYVESVARHAGYMI